MEDPQILTRRERNKWETRERLLDAARVLFAARGVTGTTIDAITTKADVARATFFNYFPGKDAVLAAMHVSHMDKLSAVVDGLLARDLTTEERIIGLFDDFVDQSSRHAAYLRVVTGELERDLATPEISAARTDLFNEEILRILEFGMAKGEVRPDYPLLFLAQMVAAVYVSVIRNWRQDPDYDLEDGFGKAARFVAEALAPR